MNRIVLYFVVSCMLLITGCSSKVSTTGRPGSQSGKYSEDLSALRPKIGSDTVKNPMAKGTPSERDPLKYVEAKYTVNPSLHAVLDSIDRINLSNGVVEGYTIQFYSGIKREEALSVKKQLATLLPEVDADIQYVQPNFRVRAGKYINRMEAQKDYMFVKRYFPNAIIIPERIPISELKVNR